MAPVLAASTVISFDIRYKRSWPRLGYDEKRNGNLIYVHFHPEKIVDLLIPCDRSQGDSLNIDEIRTEEETLRPRSTALPCVLNTRLHFSQHN